MADDYHARYGARLDDTGGSIVEWLGTATALTCMGCRAGYTWGINEPEPVAAHSMRDGGCYNCGSTDIDERTVEVRLGSMLRCGECGELNGQRQYDHHNIYVGIYCDPCFDTPTFNSYRTYVADEPLEED